MNLEELKDKNNKYLESVGIEINPTLPLIEGITEVKPRNTKDVASRLSVISYVIGIGYGADRNELSDYITEYNLWDYVSDYEKSLFDAPEVEEQDKINMTWLSECAQALAWTLGLVELNHFTHCDDNLASKVPFKESPSNFIQSSQLRSIEEIQEQADLLYRMHWYARNCRLEGKDSKLSESIISERRKAIDWVYGVAQDWDNIPSDT